LWFPPRRVSVQPRCIRLRFRAARWAKEDGSTSLHCITAGTVLTLRDRHPLAEAYVEAAQQCGYPRNDDFNGLTHEGAGYYQTTMCNGVRSSTAAGYLRSARRRANLNPAAASRAPKYPPTAPAAITAIRMPHPPQRGYSPADLLVIGVEIRAP